MKEEGILPSVRIYFDQILCYCLLYNDKFVILKSNLKSDRLINIQKAPNSLDYIIFLNRNPERKTRDFSEIFVSDYDDKVKFDLSDKH